MKSLLVALLGAFVIAVLAAPAPSQGGQKPGQGQQGGQQRPSPPPQGGQQPGQGQQGGNQQRPSPPPQGGQQPGQGGQPPMGGQQPGQGQQGGNQQRPSPPPQGGQQPGQGQQGGNQQRPSPPPQILKPALESIPIAIDKCTALINKAKALIKLLNRANKSGEIEGENNEGYSELGYSYKFLFLPNLLRAIRGDTRRADFVNFIFSAYNLWTDTRGTVSYQMYELANKFLCDPWNDAGEEETLGGGDDIELEEEEEEDEEREDEGIGEESEGEPELNDNEEADNDDGAVSNDEIEIEEAGHDERMAIINAIRGNGRFGEPPMSVERFEELQDILRHRFEGPLEERFDVPIIDIEQQ
ncbi:hypothetical protein WR25_01618 [Diploscapter pachys]|uniref:Uncharacterized protein n=1 Tax=Diploscapter pachys TaxID=2018661 RepID=A0A2A2LXQ6_9BILA|nr:hypothetical protein WR25_01618 [Diploscapter pachys]